MCIFVFREAMLSTLLSIGASQLLILTTLFSCDLRRRTVFSYMVICFRDWFCSIPSFLHVCVSFIIHCDIRRGIVDVMGFFHIRLYSEVNFLLNNYIYRSVRGSWMLPGNSLKFFAIWYFVNFVNSLTRDLLW